jgi:hypothetical protein
MRTSRCAGLGVVMLVLAACTGGASERSGAQGTHSEPVSTTRGRSPSGKCPDEVSPKPPAGPSAQAVSLGRVDGHEVEAVVYPRPDTARSGTDDNPWSQWGQGVVLADGRFVSAAGDHRGPDGNSYLFVYEPHQQRVVRFADVLSHVKHAAGEWGYGKVHAQMVVGSCGEVFVATYWGTDEDLEYGGNYRGDYLFRLDPNTLELESLGVPVSDHGIPTLAGFAPDGLLYGEAATPTPADATGSMEGAFFAYDIATGKVVFRTDDERLTGFRNVLVDAEGTAYLAAEGSKLLVYEPGSTDVRVASSQLPAGWLRASTAPAADGTVYGVTEDPERLFALRPDGHIDDLGAPRGYTASLALSADDRRVFYVPGAHGNSWEQGTPLVALDTATGEQTTVASLNDVAEAKLGLTLGGSYSVAVDPSGTRVYIGFNAGRTRDDPWGEVVLIVVHLDS